MFIQDSASRIMSSGHPPGLVYLAVDEPEGDLAQGETDNDSPKTDLHIRSYAERHVRSYADNWCGRCGNSSAQSRPISCRKPASLRRPSRWRIRAMVSSSASLQAGTGPGRAGMVTSPAAMESSTST